ncbi:hypothetical protein L5515_005951 [Caenorhabditis briggsae]|uniref:Receptor L-domain domain-containing protein n=1 Tax=Caenorhabditis briggsae TaxID=6238 RepID=A0AAE9EUQ1_CAEBR|nr:hypothetical protein L5515_005951 [Caenorhabditis briggsae]
MPTVPDPNCTFNYTEINSETAKLFPSSCYSICGLITINENTDVSFATLEKLFHRMYTLKGGLRIENTTLRSFSFLQLHGFLSFFCFPFGTRIVNNTELVDAEALENIVHVSNTSHECKIEILDNSKLDTSRLCESKFHSVPNIEVLDNGKDCGCSSGKITPRNLPDFKNCIGLFDGLVLTNMSYNSNLKSLSKIANIRGNVEIAYTNFKDLSFLKSLSKIRGNTFENLETVILDIHDNPKMKRLGLDSVSVDTLEQDWVPTMNLENLHPDFCITYQEAVSLSYVRFKNLEAKFYLRNGVSIPIGMVPYPSQLTSMFPTLCILMYIALGLSMVSLLCFMVAFLLVRKDDYSGKVRFLLHLIAGSSLLIVLLVVVTIALAGSNLALNVALGYSVWFCVASAIISAANALISEYIVGKKFD